LGWIGENLFDVTLTSFHIISGFCCEHSLAKPMKVFASSPD
jgi:hypothetical protein